MNKIKLGISSCLLGNPVRYDGGHKLDHFLTDTLGQYVDWVRKYDREYLRQQSYLNPHPLELMLRTMCRRCLPVTNSARRIIQNRAMEGRNNVTYLGTAEGKGSGG